MIQRVLAIPTARIRRNLVNYLDHAEAAARCRDAPFNDAPTCPSHEPEQPAYPRSQAGHDARPAARRRYLPCAMRLLRGGVDVTVIALWLGHDQTAATNIYLYADMTIKENAIANITPQDAAAGRYQPPDAIVEFLTSL